MLICSCILNCLPPCQKCFRDCNSPPHPQMLANVSPAPPQGPLGLWGPWWSPVVNYTLDTCWNEKVFQTADWSRVNLNSITLMAQFPIRSLEAHLCILTPYFLFSSLYIHTHWIYSTLESLGELRHKRCPGPSPSWLNLTPIGGPFAQVAFKALRWFYCAVGLEKHCSSMRLCSL